MEASALFAFLEANWGWSAQLAASMLALTVLASTLLNPARKEEIALWLMGAQTEQNWSQSFVSLFDAVFGDRHLSVRCFLRSAIASLIAVVLIWLLMGGYSDLKVRVKSELSLGAVLVMALAVNVVADYISLLETRWLLGRMHRLHSFFAQASVLLLDLVISATIIWLAILAYLNSPLHQGEIESFAKILGVFSVFSIIFYSTFLTSVWTWAFILSTWVMRLFRHLRLPDLLDVEHRPILVLGHFLALVVFLVSLAVAVPMQKDAEGLSIADRALCSIFRGQVCLDVIKLTSAELAQFDLILRACEGSVTAECINRSLALTSYNLKPEEATRLWKTACEGGIARGCTYLGSFHHERRFGIDADPVEVARLLTVACEGGDALGCSNLGVLHFDGLGVDADPVEAARLWKVACEGGDARGCTYLGVLHFDGLGVDADPVAAAQLYRRGCEGGDALGCHNIGRLHERGLGMDKDPIEAARLYRRACELGMERACDLAGELSTEQ